ncbi:L,D-transpeptidase YcbB [uncultured Gammaproteobacteria bacterium]
MAKLWAEFGSVGGESLYDRIAAKGVGIELGSWARAVKVLKSVQVLIVNLALVVLAFGAVRSAGAESAFGSAAVRAVSVTATPATFTQALTARLAGEGGARDLDRIPLNLARLRSFYDHRRQASPWFATDGGLKPVARNVLALLVDAGRDGLVPADYHAGVIAARLDSLSSATDVVARAELELLLSDGLIGYFADLRSGRVAPSAINGEFSIKPPMVNAVAVALSALTAPDLRAFAVRHAPQNPVYTNLVKLLAETRALAAAGGWPRVRAPQIPKLETGMSDPALPSLRKRLAATDGLNPEAVATAEEAEVYDPATLAAVKRFQTRHGLEPDGVIGARTVAAMNVTPAARIDGISANLERQRWLPDSLGQRHIQVNIAGFDLVVVDHGVVVEQMPVIVGTKVRRTPIFVSRITSLILNPTWTVPPKLAREDFLPKLLKDPGVLQSLGIQVYSGWGADATVVNPLQVDWPAVGEGISRFRLRQDPGPHNSLGLVKFNLDNQYDVYLHDTPHREKFENTRRTFSSGCVRLGKPLVLADYLLSDMPDWTPAKRQRALDKGVTQTVSLRSPIPVYLLYRTAWLDEAGVANFREDIYNRDQELLRAVRRPPEVPPPARITEARKPTVPVRP